MASEADQLAVVTPSYGRDSMLCRDLNRSVLRWTPEGVQHHIIVPRKDLPLFRMLANDRTIIHDGRDFLPSTIRKSPLVNMWINSQRPWQPVRGWIVQQLIKLAATASLNVGAVLLLDSDMVLVAPTDLESFRQNGKLALYRKPGAVHSGLPRHRQWLESAHDLLGLARPASEDLPDYICWPCAWEPTIVRSLLLRIEEVNERSWQSALASQIHFSEMMLYGAYIDGVLGGSVATTSSMNCVAYSDESPLSLPEISRLLRTGNTNTQAVMISAKAGIPYEIRSQALRDYEDYLSHGRGKVIGGPR